MKIIEFESSKVKIMELIDQWGEEVIKDLMGEIKSSVEENNIRDIELTIETIKDSQKKIFDLKQNIIKCRTTQRLFSLLDCKFFETSEELILSIFLDEEVKILKAKNDEK